MHLSSVRAIVTGAAGGIGAELVKNLIDNGGFVAAIDINPTGLDALRARTPHPDRLFCFLADVANEASVHGAVEQAFHSTGRCNVLINNAGILRDGLLATRQEDFVRTLPMIQWQQVINVNLTGCYLMTREFVSAVLSRLDDEPSVIVNISSISSAGNAGQSNYAASKAGLDACTRTWALELAPMGIRVAGVSPGVIDTPMLQRVDETTRTELLSKIPLKRFGKAVDVWVAVRFAIECDFFNARTLEVDGGALF